MNDKLEKLNQEIEKGKRSCAGWSMRKNLAAPGEAINPE